MVPVRLVFKFDVTHNVRRFRFALPSGEHELGLLVGRHILVHGLTDQDHSGKALQPRPYTPTTPVDTKGMFELIIKVYDKGVNGMPNYLDRLKLNQEIGISGPLGSYRHKPRAFKSIGNHEVLLCAPGGGGVVDVSTRWIRSPELTLQMSPVGL